MAGQAPVRLLSVPRAPTWGAEAGHDAGQGFAAAVGIERRERSNPERGQVKARFIWDRSGITDDKSFQERQTDLQRARTKLDLAGKK